MYTEQLTQALSIAGAPVHPQAVVAGGAAAYANRQAISEVRWW